MSRLAVTTVLAAGVLLSGGEVWSIRAQPRVSVEVSFRADFSDLDEYGEWYKLPKVGWVWVPYADRDWRPFMYGHWAWTRHGWTWISYEPFGWAVYHYGYWYYDDDLGWVWVPGYEWSSARVRWVVTEYHISWAPLPPPGFVLPPLFGPRGLWFWFTVPIRHFVSENVFEHRIVGYAPGPFARHVLREGPPDVAFIRKTIGRPVVTVTVEKKPRRAGQGRVVELYVPGMARYRPIPPVGPAYRRPIQRSEGQGPAPMPSPEPRREFRQEPAGYGPGPRPSPEHRQEPRGHGPGPHKEVRAPEHSAAVKHPPAQSPPPGQTRKEDDEAGQGQGTGRKGKQRH